MDILKLMCGYFDVCVFCDICGDVLRFVWTF